MSLRSRPSGASSKRSPRFWRKISAAAALGSVLGCHNMPETSEPSQKTIVYRIDDASAQARWMVDQILRDASYGEVMSAVRSDIESYRKNYPREYRYSVAYGDFEDEHPDVSDDAMNYFIAQLKAKSIIASCIENKHIRSFINNSVEALQIHDNNLSQNEQVRLADVLAEYYREKNKATVIASFIPHNPDNQNNGGVE